MTTWSRKNYELPEARLVQAEREIYNQFGDLVSIDEKAKSLVKFGKSATLSTDRETVWTVGGMETYVTGNTCLLYTSPSPRDS